MKKYKLAILTSHPIQYQTPLFKKISENSEIDLLVYFNWDFGIGKNSYDAEFGQKIKWDIPLLNGYKYKFLKNFSLMSSSGFWGQINFGIINELRKNKYDAVLIFGWNSFTNWLAFLTAFIFKIPVMLRGENPLNQELLKSKWKIKIKRIILGSLFKHISYFLYIGEENKKFYKYYGVPEKKLIFVPYAIDNERFMKAGKSLGTQRELLRNKIGIGDNDIIILFVGKLIGKKCPMDLLKAYHKLTTYNLQLTTHLIFVGDGALRPELEKYCKENNLESVHFTGFKNQTELPEYYAMSDIFVLPSGEGETWGLVVNEAMCFGLPVIVSDRVGCGPDLVKQEENGYIFPIGNIEELAKKLEVVFDKIKMKKFGEKSLNIINNYNYEDDIKSILDVLLLIGNN
ncbi:glycosyltransferase family 4 protein [Candidatus Wolfebacteria bacterium]|nr:glycosyltransferase family 4 protein [Candidatus Wolfebacteria bacterium]